MNLHSFCYSVLFSVFINWVNLMTILFSIVILFNIISPFMPEMFTYKYIVIFVPNDCQTHWGKFVYVNLYGFICLFQQVLYGFEF